MRFITQTDLLELSQGDAYWLSYPTRWEYMLVTMAWLQDINPTRVLEAGSNGAAICLNGDTIGLNKAHTIHDLTHTPWPIDDKQYDVFIAMQVWEHLGDEQERAFQEAARVARHIIMSFPYEWRNSTSHCHNDVDDQTIGRWAGRPPSKSLVVNGDTRRKRIVCHWRPDEDSDSGLSLD